MAEVAQMRADHLRELSSKDAEIRRLRAELGARMVAPTVQPKQVWTEPTVDAPQDWQGELTQLLKEEEEKPDGVPSE